MIRDSKNERAASGAQAITFIVLVGLVLAPAGEYRLHGQVVTIGALTPPFSDYGMFLLASAVVLALFVVVTRLLGRQRRMVPLGYVIEASWVLGLMVPDVFSRSIRTIAIGPRGPIAPVELVFGFWLTFAVAILLLAIASTAFFGMRNESNVSRRPPRSDGRALTGT